MDYFPILSDRPPLPLTEVFRDLEPFRQQARSYLKEVFDRYRIIAFCERVDSSLLWSHYANIYHGACLHFVAEGFRRHYTLGHVSYSKYRPVYPLSLALARPLERAESAKILFFTKADNWAYETEVRLVYDLKRHEAARFEKKALFNNLRPAIYGRKSAAA